MTKVNSDLVNLAKKMQEYKERESMVATALGNVVIQFGRLEVALSDVVSAGLGDGGIEKRDIIDAILSFRQKLDVISCLVAISSYDDAMLNKARDMIKKLTEFESKRNSYIHSFWGLENSSSSSIMRSKRKVKRKNGLIKDNELGYLDILNNFVLEIRECCEMFSSKSVYTVFRDIGK
jgi:hypothetical protein